MQLDFCKMPHLREHIYVNPLALYLLVLHQYNLSILLILVRRLFGILVDAPNCQVGNCHSDGAKADTCRIDRKVKIFKPMINILSGKCLYLYSVCYIFAVFCFYLS